ncbi:MAG: CsbD family protein [Anaerolineales bacterium]|nr:CsbD family protein [Anaerolineales bacterium]
MNKDEFAGQWKQLRGEVKEWWGKLTDDDLERVGGQLDQLIGVVQEKYGYTRERFEKEFNARLARAEVKRKASQARTPAEEIRDGQWKQMQGEAREWWGKLTADDVDRVAGQSGKVIGLLQERYGYSRADAEAEFTKRLAEHAAGGEPGAGPR